MKIGGGGRFRKRKSLRLREDTGKKRKRDVKDMLASQIYIHIYTEMRSKITCTIYTELTEITNGKGR